jgi:hypothetical protein
MQINQYDLVELVDGREVVVVEIYTNPDGYEVEDLKETTRPGFDEFPTFSVEPEQVKRVVEE